ncbi:MAG: adenylate/guanylate cyclase domain-containing protein [Rhodospirillales bacterium]|nr:adenylate/guanylate cyclase domain-containing protein [Rhodospirillales bacterium]
MFKVGKVRWVALVLLAAFIGFRVWNPGPLDTVRLKIFDFYQQTKPRTLLPDSPVVIIDLDEESLKEVGQWPWPRNLVAQMVANLFNLGVGVVGFDVLFPEPDRMNGENVVTSMVGLDDATKAKLISLTSNDVIFGDIIKQAKRVVVGQALLPFERKYEDRKPLRSRVFERAMKNSPKPQEWVPKAAGLLRNVIQVENSAAGHGLLSLQPEPDGIVRRVPAFFRYENRLYPTLAIEMMRLATGRSGVVAKGNQSGIFDVTIGPRKRFLVSKSLLTDNSIEKLPFDPAFNRLTYAIVSDGAGGDLLVNRAALGKVKIQRYKKEFDQENFTTLELPDVKAATDRVGRMWPYFSVRDEKKYISAKDVLSGVVEREKIAGKLAIIGTSASGLLDIKTVPTERFIPGVEVHAQLIESVLTNQFLSRPNFADAAEMAIALVAGIIIIVLVPWIGAKWTLVFFLAVVAGAGGTSWYLFDQERVLIDAAYGIFSIFIIYVTMTYLAYTSEAAQRRQTRDAFSKYLSPAMVEAVVADPKLLTLGGAKRDMTLLFCDVRGFTSISELFDAEGLTVLINKLLTPLTDIIIEHKGTIDKYMGDCVMAFWNAPLDDEKHAEDGCRAALEMVAAMAPLNQRLEQEAKEEGRKHLDLKVGLGLNSGEAVVGNMGTAQRMDYSVLGDTVNTAARLEGQSKTYGVDIVLGPNTCAEIPDFATIELDLIQVKGKTVGLQVFALMGDEQLAGDPAFIKMKETVDALIAAYRAQEWDKAKDIAQELRIVGAPFKLDVFCDLYEARIHAYEIDPPPEDWDGVFIATTK